MCVCNGGGGGGGGGRGGSNRESFQVLESLGSKLPHKHLAMNVVLVNQETKWQNNKT